MDLLLDESGTSNPVNTVIVSVALENGTDTEDNEGMLIDSSGGMVQMLSQNVEAEFSQQSENVFPEEDKIPGITLNSSDILKANDLDQTQVLKLNEDGTFAFLVTQDEEASGQGYLIQQQDTDLDESNNTLSQLDDNTMVFITECKDDPNNYEVKVENGDTTILPQSDVLLTSLDSKTTLNALSFDTKTNEGKKVNFCKDNTKKSASLFLCKTCDETFTSVSQLKLHERQHTGARVFKCDTCGKAFATAYGLKGHIRVHTNERPYRCKNCPKGFKTSGDLQKHTRTHTGERPFQCPFEGCEASFTTSNIRKVHIRRHTGEKPYKCQIEGCGKSFASATNYKNHNRIHTGEKPYQCNVMGCGKRFTEYSSLFKHNIVHTRNKPYECNLCQKTYRQTSTLSNHRKAMHGDHTMVVYDSVVKGSNVVGGALNKCGARMIPAITQLPLSLTSTLNTTTTVHSTSALNPAVSTPVLSTSIIKSDSSHNQPVVLNHGPMTVLKTIVPSLNICDKQDRLQTSEDEEGTLVINTAETGLDMNQIMPTHPTTSSTSTLLNLGITTQATEPSESDTGNQPYTMKLPTHGEQLFVVADTRLQTLELPAEVCTNDGASDILDDK